MRKKDQAKIDDIFQATLKLVNQIGFVSSSVSKIAQEAHVSPATIYIYYKNKEDLLISTYLQIKNEMHESIFKDISTDGDVRNRLQIIWFNTYNFLMSHPDYMLFIQQFEHCPYRYLINEQLLKNHLKPLEDIFRQGIDKGLIKDLPTDILLIFAFPPLLTLAANKQISDIAQNDQFINLTFDMVWDAIRL